MDRQQIIAITKAVVQQLGNNATNDVESVQSPFIAEIARQVVRQSIAETPGITRSDSVVSRSSSGVSSSSGISTTEVRTPQSDSSENLAAAVMSTPQGKSNITRSDSLSSTLSSASTTALATPPSRKYVVSRNLNFAEAEENVFAPKKRRRRGLNPERTAIARAITRPIMEAIDTQLLAKYDSPLFKRFYKRNRVNGKRVLREKYEMDMVMFKQVIRPILRRLLTRLELPVRDQVSVYSKYYRVAIQIVKKRRANHVQSWRLHGHAKKPVYDTLLPPFHQSCLAEASQQQESMDVESSQQDCDEINEGSQLQEGSMDVESDDYDPLLSVSEGGNYHDTVFCVDCSCEIPKGYSFPQSDQVWASAKSHRCKKCWTKFVKEKVGKHVEDHNERADHPPKKKTKPKTTKTCKWCNSTTHKTKKSKQCPFNKSNINLNNAEPTVITPAPAAGDAEPTVTPPVPHRQRYAIGDNVNAKWKPKQFFLGHVINFNRGLYTVYFVEDGQVKENLRDCDLRAYDGPCLQRGEMVNKCFFFPGEDDCPSGRFKIRRLLTDKNVFTCIRMTGGGSKCEGQLEDFDVGYVIRRYEQGQQRSRERGEGQILNSKRHR